MGKRELLIIGAFIAVGVVAYQLTAPRPGDGGRRLSFSSLLDNVRREVRGNRATGSVTTRGTLTETAGLTEVRISNIADLTITGETREDIGYELAVDAYGPDEQAAKDAAGRASLAVDRVGPSLRLRVPSGRGARQIARLVLVVPSRLAVYVDGTGSSTRVRATRIGALHLDSVVGDSTATEVAGAVTGSHRNGSLAISDAGGLTMTLVSSRLTLQRSRGTVSLNARNGRAEIGDSAGQLELDGTNEEWVITHPAAAVRIGGTGGRVRVVAPAERVGIDVRRAAVDVTIARAIALTATTTDAPMHVWLPAAPAVAIDAAASDGGVVDATAFGLTAATTDQESRVQHTFGAGAASVALRNQRANIVLGVAK